MEENSMNNPQFRYIADLATLDAAAKLNPPIGEIVYVQEEEKLYIYTEDGYAPYAPAAAGESGLNMSLYELNKAVVSQLTAINIHEDTSFISQINAWRAATNNVYYMLYGREISYFTVFVADDYDADCDTLGDAVVECLDYVAKQVYSLELTEDKTAMEIWISADNETATCLYLFPYDAGIVKIGE